MGPMEPGSPSRKPWHDSRFGVGMSCASVATELVGAFLIAYDFLVAGIVVLIVGLALAVGGVRLLPTGHPRHGFAVGALKSTLLLLGIAAFLQVIIWLSAASGSGDG
jgi:hypothetical protein